MRIINKKVILKPDDSSYLQKISQKYFYEIHYI